MNILQPNFTLVCADGKRVQVSKEQLCAVSSVFKDILGLETGDGEQLCEIQETSKCLETSLEVLNGDMKSKSLKELMDVMRFGTKYGIWSLQMFGRLHLEKHLTSHSIILFEFACGLNDAELALKALKVAIHKGLFFSVRRDNIDLFWATRAVNYFNATQRATSDRLALRTAKAGREAYCSTCSTAHSAFIANSFKVLHKRPTLSAHELLSASGMKKPRLSCKKCSSTLNWSSESWDKALKDSESSLDLAF